MDCVQCSGALGLPVSLNSNRVGESPIMNMLFKLSRCGIEIIDTDRTIINICCATVNVDDIIADKTELRLKEIQSAEERRPAERP